METIKILYKNCFAIYPSKKLITGTKMNVKTIISSKSEHREKPVNLNPEDLDLFQHEFIKTHKEVVLLTLKNADILKDSIYTLDGQTFYPSFTRVTEPRKKRLLKKFGLYLLPFEKVDKGIWITDEFSFEYFHWFTDALPRLIAIENSQQNNLNTSGFKVILPESYKTKAYITSSLKALNYEVHYYPSSKRVRVKELLSSSHTAPTGNFNSDLIKDVSNRLLATKKSADRKIYISREKAAQRKVLNEQEVSKLLSEFNYEIHFFEDYSFEQQLEIMSQTKSLVSIHGAGLTNMMFMPQGAQILELRKEDDGQNNCYFAMTAALNHDYYYLTNKGDHNNTQLANITVDISRLRNVLELMAGKGH